jgi:hypothetical protein
MGIASKKEQLSPIFRQGKTGIFAESTVGRQAGTPDFC